MNAIYKRKNRPIDLFFHEKVATASIDELQELIRNGADPCICIVLGGPHYIIPGMYEYPIHRAACNPDINVLHLLISHGADPCCYNSEGEQPLAYAVGRNSLEVVKSLVELGNDPSNEGYEGASTLYHAALNPDLRVIEYLMSKGVALDASSCAVYSELWDALKVGNLARAQFFLGHHADIERLEDEDDFPRTELPEQSLAFLKEKGIFL